MALMYVSLPLSNEEDYEYQISLEKNAYNIRFYYNERMKQWIWDLRYANTDPILLGSALVPNYPLVFDYITPLSGMFWLESIGKEKNETVINSFELYKYYRFYYIYDNGE